MSVTLTKNMSVRNFGGHPGVHIVTAALSSETYTLGTGVNIDLSSLQTFGQWEDVQAVLGNSSNGDSVYITKHASDPWKVNVRLYNGTTEETTGSKTLTIIMVLFQNKDLV